VGFGTKWSRLRLNIMWNVSASWRGALPEGIEGSLHLRSGNQRGLELLSIPSGGVYPLDCYRAGQIIQEESRHTIIDPHADALFGPKVRSSKSQREDMDLVP
jgi:hypothetical protein